jgi:hypothetical protein
MTRYALGTWDGQLQVEGVEDGPFPLRAHGFLQFSPKDYPNGQLMLEVRGKDIWIWVAEKKESPKSDVS